MSIIFVFGPCWNNLQTLINTIEINCRMVPDFKSVYIVTNDSTVFSYFNLLKNEKIKCNQFCDKNELHQTSCFNAIISGMKMVLQHDTDTNDDIVIFSHEDVYVKDMLLFNNSVKKIRNGYDIVCRKYCGSKIGDRDYYMNDAFLIKKHKIQEIFGNSHMMTIYPGMWCEAEFTKIIKDFDIFSIPYWDHSTHKDSELGFYHILNCDIGNIPFWDKKNIEYILNL